MNTFKRKSLHAAVLAGLGAVGLAGTANAVHVNPDGLGQALIYPYFTVRADGGATGPTPAAFYDNYISLVNTTASTKAVKVRFLEGKNSVEVLDFNLFLSPFDVWTGAIVRTDTGARLVSNDRSCVTPNALFTQAGMSDFKTFEIERVADGGGTSADRTREGYMEVIEMGVVTNTTATAAAKHNSAGIPANCAYFETNNPAGNMTPQLVPPGGGLYGGASLINVRTGTDYSYDAIALDQWSNVVQYTPTGDLQPKITDASPFISNVFTGTGVVASTWVTGAEAVSATITQRTLFNEWMLETNTASRTDWVITFPTKNRYVNVAATAAGAVAGTAANPFNANYFNGRSCDVYTLVHYNREEQTAASPISPSPLPGASARNLCAEVNTLAFGASPILGSIRGTGEIGSDVPPPSTLLPTGHAIMTFDQTRQFRTADLGTTLNGVAQPLQRYYGLPVVGFAVQDYKNLGNAVPGVLSVYGAGFVHKYRRLIAP